MKHPLVAARKLAVASLLIACNTALAAAPDWVNQPPQRKGFVFGVGAADLSLGHAAASEAAKLAARNEIASSLKLQIGSELTLNNISDESGSRSEFNNNIRIRVPDVALSDIRIIKTGEVAEHQSLYSLAELDLAKAAGRVASEIRSLLAQTSPAIDSTSLATALRGHYRALERQLNFQSLLSQYRLLDGKQPFNDSALNNDAERALKFFDNLLIHIAPKDEDSKKVARNIASELAAKGLQGSESANQAKLQLSMNSQRRTMERNGAHFCRIKTDATLSANTQHLSAASRSAKAVSGDPEIACQKAAEKLSKVVAADIMNTFWDTLKSPSPKQN
ncbi:LPP20 family lipoprotein [Spongiibacter marinus]|uniref:LPP20 family lipoprotein n=1 Tax=Spongiibacter marinus TaxID=354246 RepID=UPI003562DE47